MDRECTEDTASHADLAPWDIPMVTFDPPHFPSMVEGIGLGGIVGSATTLGSTIWSVAWNLPIPLKLLQQSH